MKEVYDYMVRRKGKLPALIRLGMHMEAEMYVYPGEWEDKPELNDIRLGLGAFMEYTDISDEEAEEIRQELQEAYDKRTAEKGVKHAGN